LSRSQIKLKTLCHSQQGVFLKPEGAYVMQQLIIGVILIGVFFLLILFIKSGYNKKNQDEQKK